MDPEYLLGEKEDFILSYRMPLDRVHAIFIFFWCRFSYGHQYGEVEEHNSTDGGYWERETTYAENGGVEDEGKYVSLPPKDFSIDATIENLLESHSKLFEKIKINPPKEIGHVFVDEINSLMKSMENNRAYCFRDAASMKSHFLANPDIPEIMKKVVS